MCVPGKALLFGEYGLLLGREALGIVLTLPSFSFRVRVSTLPRILDAHSGLPALPFLEVKSAFLGPEGLVASWSRFAAWCDEAMRAQLEWTSHERYFFSVLFPFRRRLEKAKCSVRVEVLESFDPSLGLGSSSALLVAVHEGLRRTLSPSDPARLCASPPVGDPFQTSVFEAALESIQMFQGRGSGYDAQVQAAALGTLSPRVYAVVPGVRCDDVTSEAFAAWQRDLDEGHAGFSLHPSGTYAPTAQLLAQFKGAAWEHAALAHAWRQGGFRLSLLPELFERSRALAAKQGLFGDPGGRFAALCGALQQGQVAFKTTGSGHGDALLCLSVPAQTSHLAPPFFRLEDVMSKRLPLSLVRLQEMLRAARERGELVVQAGDRGFASAPSNIALIKYWGKKADALQVPVNASLSYSLAGFRTFTCVEARASLDPLHTLPANVFSVEAQSPSKPSLHRMVFWDSHGEAERTSLTSALTSALTPFQEPDAKVARFLDRILKDVAPDLSLSIVTSNTFPTACGIASSASGFAALTAALGELFDVERHLGAANAQMWRCEWARIGSGSATRSCYFEDQARFVAWEPLGNETEAPCRTYGLPHHTQFNSLGHGVVVFDAEKKAVSSSEGHEGASSSPLQGLRVAGIPRAFARATQALALNDFNELARVSEDDAFAMHAVMQTAKPPACYFRASTEAFLKAFIAWRNETGLPVFWTLDAGPNVHLLYRPEAYTTVVDFVRRFAAGEPDLRVFLENGHAAPAGLVVGASEVARLWELRHKLLVRHEFPAQDIKNGISVSPEWGSVHA